MTETHWNGIPIKARRGTAIVSDDTQRPLYWARLIVGQRIAVVEADLTTGTEYLDNRDGTGWAKVTTGGSPRELHRALAIEPGSFEEDKPDELGEANILRLEPDDIIIIRQPGQITPAMTERIIALAKDVFTDHKVVVLEDGAEIQVARPVRADGSVNAMSERAPDPTEVGQIWRHKASGDEYMRGAWIDPEGNETARYWKHLPFGIVQGSPKDVRREHFLDEFELVGKITDDGEEERF